MLTFLCVVLGMVALIAIATHFAMWFWAYQEVKGLESWSQQARALDELWIFDKNLLPKEHDHLRTTALWSAIVAALCSWTVFYLIGHLR